MLRKAKIFRLGMLRKVKFFRLLREKFIRTRSEQKANGKTTKNTYIKMIRKERRILQCQK